MTKEELKTATGQELIEQRNYCGVDGYYGAYLDNVNEEMLNRFNRLSELEAQIEKMKNCDNCIHCGCGSCDEAGNCICDDCNEETLSEWECIL